MNKKEIIEKIQKELEDLYSYAVDVRGDWSCFDGRDLLRNVSHFKSKVEEQLAKLKEESNG